MPLPISPSLSLPDAALSESFSRATGPGGQNVNKVATAVELRLALGRSGLPDAVKTRVRALAGHRLTVDDEIVIDAKEHRTQAQNREAARERLVALLQRALVRPKVRRKTKPTLSSREQRLEHKVRRSRVKARRSSKIDTD
jgi:ribosome-associated protein